MSIAPAGLGRWRRVRRRYTDVPFAGVLALLGVNAGVNAILQPETQPARHLASPWDTIWVLMYTAGGLLILLGMGSRRANIEAAGCMAFGGGAAVSAIATAVVRGWHAWNAVGVLTLFCAAASVRAWHLAHGRVLVLVDVTHRAEL